MIIEVKNTYSEEQFLEHAKHQALRDLCDQYGITCEVWSNRKIKSLGYKLEVLLEDERVELYARP